MSDCRSIDRDLVARQLSCPNTSRAANLAWAAHACPTFSAKHTREHEDDAGQADRATSKAELCLLCLLLLTCLPKGCKGTACLMDWWQTQHLRAGHCRGTACPWSADKLGYCMSTLICGTMTGACLAQQDIGMDLRLLVWTACFAKSAGDLSLKEVV